MGLIAISKGPSWQEKPGPHSAFSKDSQVKTPHRARLIFSIICKVLKYFADQSKWTTKEQKKNRRHRLIETLFDISKALKVWVVFPALPQAAVWSWESPLKVVPFLKAICLKMTPPCSADLFSWVVIVPSFNEKNNYIFKGLLFFSSSKSWAQLWASFRLLNSKKYLYPCNLNITGCSSKVPVDSLACTMSGTKYACISKNEWV